MTLSRFTPPKLETKELVATTPRNIAEDVKVPKSSDAARFAAATSNSRKLPAFMAVPQVYAHSNLTKMYYLAQFKTSFLRKVVLRV